MRLNRSREQDAERALTLASASRLPRTFSFMVQRIAAMKSPDALRVLAERLARTTDAAEQADLLNGLTQMLKKEPPR